MTDRTPPGIIRQPYPIKARLLAVVRTEDLSPDMRRIVLAGDDLEATLPFVRLASADHVKLVIPDETTGKFVLPVVGERGLNVPNGVAPAIRSYTIRAFDPIKRELSIDFVLHDHGPAGRWAIGARPGALIGVMGPRGNTVYPGSYARYVIAADETALPATERWIEEAPADAVLEAFVLVADVSRERALPRHPRLNLHWLHRDNHDDLADAVQAAVPIDDGDTFVWAAAEATSMKPLRSHLRGPAGFDRRSIDIHGYWKFGEADHHESRGPDSHDETGRG